MGVKLLVIPVYNEERVLESSISKLYEYMSINIKKPWKIVIANNASTDKTKEIADELTKRYDNIEAAHLTFKGRGNALKTVWSKYNADIYAYCDVDLATDISHIKELFYKVEQGYDVMTGSRYLKTSKSRRTFDRLFLSKGYIWLIKIFFKTEITDFQCGFKAINDKIKKEIIPSVQNKEWFFDTELMLRAEKSGKYRIGEIPVKWREGKETKLKIFKTVYQYVKNLMRLKKRLK